MDLGRLESVKRLSISSDEIQAEEDHRDLLARDGRFFTFAGSGPRLAAGFALTRMGVRRASWRKRPDAAGQPLMTLVRRAGRCFGRPGSGTPPRLQDRRSFRTVFDEQLPDARSRSSALS